MRLLREILGIRGLVDCDNHYLVIQKLFLHHLGSLVKLQKEKGADKLDKYSLPNKNTSFPLTSNGTLRKSARSIQGRATLYWAHSVFHLSAWISRLNWAAEDVLGRESEL